MQKDLGRNLGGEQLTTGTEKLGKVFGQVTPKNEPMEPLRLTLRQTLVVQAPPPPSWWKVQTPLDSARWAWVWVDALLATQYEATTPGSAEQPGRQRPR